MSASKKSNLVLKSRVTMLMDRTNTPKTDVHNACYYFTDTNSSPHPLPAPMSDPSPDTYKYGLENMENWEDTSPWRAQLNMDVKRR